MTRLLSLFGLMRVSEHERIVDGKDRALRILQTAACDHIAKFKKAVADLEKQAGEIAALKRKLSESEMLCHSLDAERNEQASLIADLRPDAEAMRKKRAADRKRMAGKRGKA